VTGLYPPGEDARRDYDAWIAEGSPDHGPQWRES
jgi:hypothetical protein